MQHDIVSNGLNYLLPRPDACSATTGQLTDNRPDLRRLTHQMLRYLRIAILEMHRSHVARGSGHLYHRLHRQVLQQPVERQSVVKVLAAAVVAAQAAPRRVNG